MTLVDTKVDLAVNPMGWLTRALQLWNPVSNFGEVQNQAYGYAWPMGPFFAAGTALGAPAWVVQRLWWALLLCTAYAGIVALANRLVIGTPATRMIAGVAFALSPRILTELGTISVEAWPSAVAPWVLVPLIGLSKNKPIGRSVVLSALAITCAGGVNATAVFATLPLALLWLAMLRDRRRRWRAVGAWCLAVACATAWWLVPLLLLGRYSPPFLDYIETSEVTTRVTDLVSVLRGTSHWLPYLSGTYGPQMPAGYRLIHEPVLLAATVAVAAIGLAGLARRGLPHRKYLIAGLLMGVAMVSLGHLSELDTGLVEVARRFLDTTGAPLRNVHKFDVLLRLPLALGIAHMLGLFVRASAWRGKGWHLAKRRVLVTSGAAVAAIATAASPALAGGLSTPGSFLSVPQYWHEAADWLNKTAGQNHLLVIPGARFPKYFWGSPTDEITQPLLESHWGVRSSIPLTPASTIRMLDSIESVLASGTGSPGLADYLARNDVKYLLLRSDLDYGKSNSTRPALARQALLRSPGIVNVQSFGPEIASGPILTDYYDYGFGLPIHPVEIFEIQRPVSPAGLYDASAVRTVSGGPESLLELQAAGSLGSAPTILAGDLGNRQVSGPVTLTDGLRRREIAFGRSQDTTSATMTADDPWTIPGAAHDYLPSWGEQRTTTMRYEGVKSITASSSWSQALPLSGTRPQHQPFAAMDGDLATSWKTPPDRSVIGQWFEVTLRDPVPVSKLDITFDGTTDYFPSKVNVVVGPEVISADVPFGKLSLDVPSGLPTTRIKIIVTEVLSTLRVGGGGIGISELTVAGVKAERTLVVPAGPAVPSDIVLAAAPPVASCIAIGTATRCNPEIARGSEDNGRIDRIVTVPADTLYQMKVWARPTPGPDLDQTIDAEIAKSRPLGIAPLVTGSSRGINDPAGRPGAVVDGDPSTAWYVGNGDGNASLRLTWPAARTIAGLKLSLDPNVAATRPDRVTIVGSDGTRGGALNNEGVLIFDRPMRTNEITIFFLDPFAPARSKDPYTNTWRLLPMAVGDITVLPDLPSAPANLDQQVDLPCGSGPTVTVAGTTMATRIHATLRDLIELREVPATICGIQQAFVPQGQQRVIAARGTVTSPSRLAMTIGAPPAAGESPVTISRWDATQRRIQVTASDKLRILVVRENVNSGWTATIGGFTLPTITLDGWQQGWYVAPGLSGDIVLTYEPNPAFQAAVLGGGGLVAGLVAVAVFPWRGKGSQMPHTHRRRRSWLALLTGLAGLAVAGGLWSVAIAAGILLLFTLYWASRGQVSTRDRRRIGRIIKELPRWMPPVLLCLAGYASLQAEYPVFDALPQALALGALVILWLSTMARPVPSAAAQVRRFLNGPLSRVIADGRQDKASSQPETGETQRPPAVDKRDYQQVP